MFGTSGIRGPLGTVITTDLGVRLGRSLGEWGATHVVIGRDVRPSGAALVDAVAAGLREYGVDVTDVGMAATPTIARSVAWCDADAGVAVTASHNPSTDNGFKCWLPSGRAFGPAEQSSLEGALEGSINPDRIDPRAAPARSRWNAATERHVEAIVAATSVEGEPTVVVDLGNGAGQVCARALDELGCHVHTVNGQPDGRFPGRPSEPTAANCSALREMVPAIGADLGIAHDGDADRMLAVDATGRWIGGDTILGVFATAVAGNGDQVAFPVDTSLAVEDALASVGASAIRTRVGDVFVADQANEPGVVFGGEPSGTWIFPDETLSPDGPLAAARLVSLVSREGSLAELADAIPAYPIRRKAIEVTDKPRVMERVSAVIDELDGDVETIDGVRLATDHGWLLIRPSGTEPIVRLTAEAREEKRADALLETGESVVREAIEAETPP